MAKRLDLVDNMLQIGPKAENVFSLEPIYAKKDDVQLIQAMELLVGVKAVQEQEDSVA
ncbi:MAG: hypothetical protein WCE90_13440 [Candidatus Zixiibacteriota bacterium]